jgi:ribosomal protein L7Ae-like RNA K-turn-binding protein
MAKCRDRIISAFGLAKRAGKCVTGTSMCVDSIREEKAKLVICACDLSENTKKRLNDSCSFHNVGCIFLDCDMNYLGSKLGIKNGTACAAVLDDGFVEICRKLYSEIHTETTEVQ